MSRPPTLETVAERAGVSRATVSRVVNGDPRVADRLRTAVEEAVRELGFVPNQAARSLATRRTGSVALVLSDEEPSWSVAAVVRDAVAGTDLQLVVLLSRPETEARVAAYARHHVDGVLVVGAGDELARQLAEWQVPVVVGGRTALPVPDTAAVDVDNVAGGRLAAERLVRRGRTRLGLVTGPADRSAHHDREAGFRQVACVEHVVRADGTVAGGAQAIRTLLAAARDLDGVFLTADLMALGALHALAAAGRRVPDDVAVVGFGDVDLAAVSAPPLTTVRVPWRAQATRMVELLVDRMAGGSTPDGVLLGVELVGRESA